MKFADKSVIYLLCLIITVTIIAPVITGSDPLKIDLDSLKQPPSIHHLFGTDTKGRDIFSRVLYGGRVSLGISLLAAVFSMSIGFLVGLIAGYAGGRIDSILTALIDLVLSFPSLLLAIGISVVLPPGIYTVMIAIASVGWASFARVIRGYILTIREMPYVESARAVGCSGTRILLFYLLPQCIPIGIVMMGLKLGGYIITEASLGFLGLGQQPPAPSWGGMISAGRAYILSEPWIVFFPGAAIVVTALCFNLLGDILRDSYGLRIK
ncbi:glutathione transport system permease protein GsiD [bacterium BMS3Abin07]|nr:glutathione transport system permease protein GsiD [bacterium BMS3Abin07]GBE31308.1 glutathione transport system permease protein GsiD [bacterium BMS3Bbin05]HDO22147.1 ABC transporter permease [Nitrospirota bacterium]HDZ88291.1 ABC transporter permease [Nitrospirota bacterium]